MYTFWLITTAFLSATNCSLLGSWLIVRREIMVGDALTHAVLPGLVISFLITGSLGPVSMLAGAFFAGILAVLTIGTLRHNFGIRADLAIAFTFTLFFAVGMLLISFFTQKSDLDQECVLFGSLLHVPLSMYYWGEVAILPKEVLWLVGLLIVNVLLLWGFHRQFLLISFDATFARISGVSVLAWQYFLLTLVAVTAVFVLKLVGIPLVTTLLVVPPASAWLLTDRLSYIFILTPVFNFLSACLGYVVAVRYNVDLAASVATLSGGLFAAVFCFERVRNYRF